MGSEIRHPWMVLRTPRQNKQVPLLLQRPLNKWKMDVSLVQGTLCKLCLREGKRTTTHFGDGCPIFRHQHVSGWDRTGFVAESVQGARAPPGSSALSSRGSGPLRVWDPLVNNQQGFIALFYIQEKTSTNHCPNGFKVVYYTSCPKERFPSN